MSGRFEGRTVVVTGASRGLGRDIATAFGSEGAFVYVGFRSRQDEAERTCEAVVAAGGEAAPLGFDVTDRPAVDAAVGEVLAGRGQIDVWVNNAGIAADAPLLFLEPESFKRVLGVDLVGVFHGCQAACRPMLTRGSGAIVNIGSVSGHRASPGQASYAAAKGGLAAMTRTLAAELAPRGVRVNAVVPGLLDVGLASRLDHRIQERYRARIPLSRFGRGEEVAAVVLFAASDEASYLVGQCLVVDGGLTL